MPLVAERSIAIDPKTIPLGSLLWVDSHYPDSKTLLQKLVFAQDTGELLRENYALISSLAQVYKRSNGQEEWSKTRNFTV